jgi:hypothetical protein
MQQNCMWSLAFGASTKEILQEVWWSNVPDWIVHA